MNTHPVAVRHDVLTIHDLPREPPQYCVLFFGKCGVGKSSTINALFGLAAATDHAVACTKFPTFFDISTPLLGRTHSLLRVIDMPGIGESLDTDQAYMPFYTALIPMASVLVWITQADTRAYKRDELFMRTLIRPCSASPRFILALNKVDALGVDDGHATFIYNERRPSDAQLTQLPAKIRDVYETFSAAYTAPSPFELHDVIPYSAVYGWGLDTLRCAILNGD